MGKHRVKEEKLQRIRLGSRYVGLDLGQFYWECMKLAAAAEELTETDIVRRIIRTWSETLPATMREQARALTASVEVWKAEQIRARKETKLRAKQTDLHMRQVKLRGKEAGKPLRPLLGRRATISASS